MDCKSVPDILPRWADYIPYFSYPSFSDKIWRVEWNVIGNDDDETFMRIIDSKYKSDTDFLIYLCILERASKCLRLLNDNTNLPFEDIRKKMGRSEGAYRWMYHNVESFGNFYQFNDWEGDLFPVEEGDEEFMKLLETLGAGPNENNTRE